MDTDVPDVWRLDSKGTLLCAMERGLVRVLTKLIMQLDMKQCSVQDHIIKKTTLVSLSKVLR